MGADVDVTWLKQLTPPTPVFLTLLMEIPFSSSYIKKQLQGFSEHFLLVWNEESYSASLGVSHDLSIKWEYSDHVLNEESGERLRHSDYLRQYYGFIGHLC